MAMRLEFSLLEERYALTHLPPGSPHPDWVRGRFAATISSREGLSIVCVESAVPTGPRTQTGFRCLEVLGAFDIESVGVLAAAVQPLARSAISLFAYSTWQTDYILVQEKDLDRALASLRDAGHAIAYPALRTKP